MLKTNIKQIALAVSLACFALQADAAGLGKLNALSGLGEPLVAEIEIESATPEEINSLSAAIADQEAYSVQGLQRDAIHDDIQISVGRKQNGTPVLKLRSNRPINDPFVDMLIQLDWNTGRLVREYTLLLDPVGYDADKPSVASVQTLPEAATVASSAKTDEMPSAKPTVSSAKSSTEGDEVTTKRGDTLSKIARNIDVEGVSLDQMLTGLYRANQHAFVNNNMNQLKVGQIIKVPTAEELQSISRKDASQEVKVHASDWNGYRNKVAEAVAAMPVTPEESKSQSTEGKLAAPKIDAPKAPEGPRDVVKLSKAEESKQPNSKETKTLKDKIDALQEETLAREKGIKEANERAAALEKQIDDLQKLLTLKSKSMADIEKNAKVAEEPKKAETTPAKPEEAKPAEPVAAPAAEAKPEEVKPQEPAKVAELKPAKEKSKDKPKASKKAPKKKRVAPAPEPESAGFFDGMDWPIIGGLGALLAALGGGWFYYRNKRRNSLDSFEKGILTAGALKANTVFGNTAGGTVDTGDTSFLTDFSQSTGGMIDTHDVDPIAEAEVYMAYGREAQAEEILKDAIAKDPTRYELHLKLLSIYAGRNDTSAFEAVAGELYTTLGATHPTWHSIAEMGHAMEPTNPLYDVSGTPSSAVEATPIAASEPPSDLGMDETQVLNASDFASADLVESSSLDFSLDAGTSDDIVPEKNDASMDFDLGSIDSSVAEIASPAIAEAIADEPEISFDLGTEVPVEAPAADESLNFDFNLGENDTSEVAPALTDTVEMQAASFDIPAAPAVEEILDIGSAEAPAVVADEISLDFNIDTNQSDTSAPLEINLDASSEPVSEISIPEEIVLDLDVATSEKVNIDSGSESEEVNTKLDLVAAYIDMGDAEGARELLAEVVKEGGPKQRARAEELLAGLA